MNGSKHTVAFVQQRGDAVRLASVSGVTPDQVDEIVAEGEESIDTLQDRIYVGDVTTVLLPNEDILGPDVMAREMMRSGWAELGITVIVESDEPQPFQHGVCLKRICRHEPEVRV